MQLVDEFIGITGVVMSLVRQQRAAGLINKPVALGGVQREHIRRVAGTGVVQLAQIIKVGRQQRRQRLDRRCRTAAHGARESGLLLGSVRDELEHHR